MCCVLTTLALVGPRAAVVVWWFLNPLRFRTAFDSAMWPILGFLFLPWTTLAYLAAWSPGGGIQGLDWVWLALGLIIDLGTHTGGAYGNRDRLRRRETRRA